MDQFLERHANTISGVLSSFDQVIISSTIPDSCFADGMKNYLKTQGIRIFDFMKWAELYRDKIW